MQLSVSNNKKRAEDQVSSFFTFILFSSTTLQVESLEMRRRIPAPLKRSQILNHADPDSDEWHWSTLSCECECVCVCVCVCVITSSVLKFM